MGDKKIVKSEQKKVSSPESSKGVRYFKPLVDICEDENEIIFTFDVPGAVKDKIDINIDEDVLTLTAEIEEIKPEKADLIHREYVIGAYRRSFTLIDTIDKSKVNAKYNNGVLRIVLPKKEEEKPKQIKVQVG